LHIDFVSCSSAKLLLVLTVFGGVVGGFICKMMLSESNDYDFLFTVWIPILSFSHLIALTRTSSTMLNKSGESGHPCLSVDLTQKAFSFSSFNIRITGFFINNI
jgi:hypothetical protein